MRAVSDATSTAQTTPRRRNGNREARVRKDRGSAYNRLNLAAQRFGRLTVQSSVPAPANSAAIAKWLCLCDCGTSTEVIAASLTTGNTQSCGCLRLERLRSATSKIGRKSRAYVAWGNMKSRCLNPNNRGFRNYGAKGVTICASWLHDFDAFYADMGEAPPGMTLERKNVRGNYEPNNCIWASKKEQANKRHHIFIPFGVGLATLSQVCDELNYFTVYARIHKFGWPVEKAVGALS